MKYFCNPINVEYKFQMVELSLPGNNGKSFYRELADPSLVLFKGTYFMFPSMAAGYFTSEDLVEWEFKEFLGDIPIYDYAPDVCVVDDYLYFSASKRNEVCSFFRTKDPRTEDFEEIEGTFPFWDPHMFHDDDGRLYFFWGCSNVTPIYGVELDKETMKPLTEPFELIDSHPDERGYERKGVDHVAPKTKEQIDADIENFVTNMLNAPQEQRDAMGFKDEDHIRFMAQIFMGNSPFIEGAWQTKYNGKYYLQYAIPETQKNVYGDGVYVSDNPLGPYKPQENNPYSYKPGGFINGAGHGSTLKDKQGNYWHTASMSISLRNDMERRLGLWKAGFDAEGELFCDQRYGDWVTNIEKAPFEKPDFMLLSYGKNVTASTGVGMKNVTDENIHTWWKTSDLSVDNWIKVDLGKVYDVRAVQVNFAEDDLEVEFNEILTKASDVEARYTVRNGSKTRWTLEYSSDDLEYFTLEDKSNVDTDKTHELVLCEDGRQARYIKLNILEAAYNQTMAVSGVRVFGNGDGELPKAVESLKFTKQSDLDVVVNWEDTGATGYNVLWGISPEKLYHSYLVYGVNEKTISAIVKGQRTYFRVDSFNEKGITEGVVELYPNS